MSAAAERNEFISRPLYMRLFFVYRFFLVLSCLAFSFLSLSHSLSLFFFVLFSISSTYSFPSVSFYAIHYCFSGFIADLFGTKRSQGESCCIDNALKQQTSDGSGCAHTWSRC